MGKEPGQSIHIADAIVCRIREAIDAIKVRRGHAERGIVFS